MEPVTHLVKDAPRVNPLEMERVIRAAGWLYCGAGIWRHSSERDAKFAMTRVPVEDAFRLVMRA